MNGKVSIRLFFVQIFVHVAWTKSVRLNLIEILLKTYLPKKTENYHNFPPEKTQNSALRKVSVGLCTPPFDYFIRLV